MASLSFTNTKSALIQGAFLTIFGSQNVTFATEVYPSGILGTIPFIGLCIGIIRLLNIPKADTASLIEDKFQNKCLKGFCIFRATLEILGLGIICLVIDIIVDLAYKLKSYLSNK